MGMHRIGPVGDARGRALIVSLRKLSTKVEIVEMTKKKHMLQVRGMKLRVFADLTSKMARKRTSSGALKSADVRHGIIHPATLILTFKGETEKFTIKSDAEMYYTTVIEPGLKKKG